MNPRRIAISILLRVEEGAYSHIALKEALLKNDLSSLDKAFVTELVYGTIRRRNTLDFIINSFLQKKTQRDEIRCILRMGVYQLRYMRVPPSAAVNESVKLVSEFHLESQKGFVNAVLRNIERSKDKDFYEKVTDKTKRMALTYSHPSWIVARYIEKYGIEKAAELLDYNNKPSRNIARVNIIKTSIADLIELLEKEGIEAEPYKIPNTIRLKGQGKILSSNAYRKGLFMIQSPSSVAAALMLDARAGESVLDTCAAPGGKSFVLAQQMDNLGEILSTDIHPHKIELMQKGFQFLGIQNAEAKCQDWEEWNPAFDQRYDRVLVDAPCSGLGVLGKRPDSRWRKKASDIEALVQLQRKILNNAVLAVKPGGLLMYATCTLTYEENQAQRAWILENFTEFKPEPLPYISEAFASDKKALERGELEITPFMHDMEGFYLTLLRKDTN
ncbi:16S rRNA (cytosine(967)-C(5))-methyltransferase RsmB [Clostridia bacterium]|nr:16S rRNA (cytosine(967)-C(5))-methyltransferase RsmB [Clostridia bacterium]